MRSILFCKKYKLDKVYISKYLISRIHKSAELAIGKGTTIARDYSLRAYTVLDLDENSKLEIGERSKICYGAKIQCYPNATIRLGKHCYINEKTTIRSEQKVTIGDYCGISWNVTIMDTDRHYILENQRKKEKAKPIVIGNHCWIGCNVTLLKGVTLGDNCIVAAGSVVTKSFPANSLIGGNPAHLIKSDVDWES